MNKNSHISIMDIKNKSYKSKIFRVHIHLSDFLTNYEPFDYVRFNSNDEKFIQFRIVLDERDKKTLQMCIPKLSFNSHYREEVLDILQQHKLVLREETLSWQDKNLIFYQVNFGQDFRKASTIVCEIFTQVFGHTKLQSLVVDFGHVGELVERGNLSFKLGYYTGRVLGKVAKPFIGRSNRIVAK